MLLAEVLTWLQPQPGKRYVDATVGAGGHARAILEASAPDGRLLGLDVDADALSLAANHLRIFGDRVRLEKGSFRELRSLLPASGFGSVDGMLFDLGVSSMQLDRPGRGFSFAAEGPLDMRLDPDAGQPASVLVNTLPERELADLLFTLGEEPAARRIARAIARRRASRPFGTTTDLARVVGGAAGRGGRTSWRIHPATRTFQALRIAVNDELGALECALPAAVDALAGGQLVVIAFHSWKTALACFSRPGPGLRARRRRVRCPAGRLRILTHGRCIAGATELGANPRSRSAKLPRCAEENSTPPEQVRPMDVAKPIFAGKTAAGRAGWVFEPGPVALVFATIVLISLANLLYLTGHSYRATGYDIGATKNSAPAWSRSSSDSPSRKPGCKRASRRDRGPRQLECGPRPSPDYVHPRRAAGGHRTGPLEQALAARSTPPSG